MTALSAGGFPEDRVRERARDGAACAFPPHEDYGHMMVGATPVERTGTDLLDDLRLVPPVFVPQRLEKLIDLGREPLYQDVSLDTVIGGFRSPLPVFVSALGSTKVAGVGLGEALSRQAGSLGVPMVIGENIMPAIGYGRLDDAEGSLVGRVRCYTDSLPDDLGGLVVQQSTEDADAEVWNQVYSDPSAKPLLESGRLAFELKVGQGAKPGLGGMTVLDEQSAAGLADRFSMDAMFADDPGRALRCASPGTFTEEILKQQIRLMRNNFPRARVWVKLHPARDVAAAAAVAWQAGADAVTVDGAEGGSGWAPLAFLDHVGLPLAECLSRIGRQPHCLLANSRMWEGSRAVKAMALGATGVGLGRAAFLATDEDHEHGLRRLVECMALEMRLLISALGKYEPTALDLDDVWPAPATREANQPVPASS